MDGQRLQPVCPLDDGCVWEILVRIPANNLIGMRLVCKWWKTILDDPIFIREHLARSCQERGQLMFWCREQSLWPNGQVRPSLRVLSRHTLTLEPVNLPAYTTNREKLELVGEANGLICFAYLEDTYTRISIYNPATGQMREISNRPQYHNPGDELRPFDISRYDHGILDVQRWLMAANFLDFLFLLHLIIHFFHLCTVEYIRCFGYDAACDDYVIATGYREGPYPAETMVYTYSVRHHSWSAAAIVPTGWDILQTQPICVNGTLVWFARALEGQITGNTALLCYNRRWRIWRTSLLPPLIQDMDGVLMDFHGCVGVLGYEEIDDDTNDVVFFTGQVSPNGLHGWQRRLARRGIPQYFDVVTIHGEDFVVTSHDLQLPPHGSESIRLHMWLVAGNCRRAPQLVVVQDIPHYFALEASFCYADSLVRL